MESDYTGVVFLDRDGVLNEERFLGVRSPQQLRILPGVPAALGALGRAGYALVVVTNKPGIALKMLDEKQLLRIHEELDKQVEPSGARILAYYHCPHLPISKCECRKPKPGMLANALARHDLPKGNLWIVGDRCSDLQAGQHVGARGILINTRHACDHEHTRADSLAHAAKTIISHGAAP